MVDLLVFNPSPRRRNQTRRAVMNPQGRDVAVASAITVLVVGVVGTTAALVRRHRRRQRENLLPIDTVAPAGGQPEAPRGSVERPMDPPAAPTSTGQLPAEILAGGVPLEPGWSTVAWYRYPPAGNQRFWIRVDQRGIPSWSEWSASDMHTVWEEDGDAIFHDEDGVSITHGHFGRIQGAWRWTVIAGEATPLATELLEGAYLFRRPILYLRYDRESLENGMLDFAAQRAADWIDTAYDL